MLVETGRVVAIEPHHLWVETLRKSACGKCSAKSGCGHGLMNTYAGGGKLHRVKVLLGNYSADDFQLHDDVEIALNESVLVNGALLVYILPLCLMALGTVAGNYFGGHDALAALGALLGLIVGFVLVVWRNRQLQDDCIAHPVVIGHYSSVGVRLSRPELLARN